MLAWGVAAALAGAVLLALGAQLQGRGVRSAADRSPRGTPWHRRLRALLTDVGWLRGTGLLVLAILLQLVGLLLAPLPVVQPLGVLSLVVAALLTHRLERARISARGLGGIIACVAGTGGFVVTAALVTRSSAAPTAAVVPVLVILGALLTGLLALVLTRRKRLPAVAWAIAGGACFGFTATLMKALLDRSSVAIQRGDLLGPALPFSLLILAAAGAAGLAGISLVQRAYAGGSAGLVVAALTVVDPLMAIALGIALLGQASGAPGWSFAVLAAAEAVALAGVALMARNPPRPDERAVAAASTRSAG
ncbi:DMT family transporter [Amnibacterium endophyticum]|uniref:DMT family transporter n=1 Tax=Amnibacterium endophyticum TaxID=2109337 RepID=A0ABW4LEE3_9MICO